MATQAIQPVVDAAKLDDWREGLSLSEQAFVEEYLVDLNGSNAIRRMGNRTKRPDQAAHKFKSNPKVRAAIHKLFATRGVTKLRLVEEASAVAFADVTDYVTVETDPDTGRQRVKIKDTSELSEEQRRALASITTTTNEFGTTITVKPHSKMEALGFIAKALGHTVDKHEVSGTVVHQISAKEMKNELNSWFDNLRDNLLAGAGVPIGPGQTLLPPVKEQEKAAVPSGK